MQFFKKKSEQSVNQTTRSASQHSLHHDSQRSQVNGNACLGHDEAYYLRNSSLDNQLSMKMSYIYIDCSDIELEELFLGYSETNQPQKSSQLSKTLEQVLHDKDALPYFIQYMDSVGSSNLIKFWLDADTFRLTSLSRMNLELASWPVDANQQKQQLSETVILPANQNVILYERLKTVSLDHSNSTGFVTPLGNRSHSGSVTAHGHEQILQNLSSSSPTQVQKIACESASLVLIKESGCSGSESNFQTRGIPQSLNQSMSQGLDAKVLESSENSYPLSSQNSSGGIALPVTNTSGPKLQQHRMSNFPTTSKSLEGDTLEGDLDSLQALNKSIENDAIVIFSKYFSPDCLNPISISDDLRDRTVGQICHEDGTVDPRCFDNCQQYVFDLMETRYFSNFLQSVYYIKHQIDILSQLLLVDILYNNTALSYFTEFMEEQKAMMLLQCFLDLDNFQHHLLSQGIDYDANEAQNDAMIIYDKYISMQATQPVQFNDKVRLKVESNICRESGLLPDCFHIPCQLVLRHMEKVHYPLFLKSEMYTKYVTDLLNTSQLMQDSVEYRRKRTGSDASSEKSSGSQSTGNESLSSKNTYLARDTSGQHFAKALNRFSDNMRIDSSLFNPDSLWHRPNAGHMKFGKVTELGQFVSDFDPDPDHDKKKLAPFFTVTKKREREKSEEDMAWQVAQQIISAVMTETSSDCSPSDAKDA